MIKIEVAKKSVNEYTSKRTGKPYYKQDAYAHVVKRDGSVGKYPAGVELFLSKNAAGEPEPYEVGFYQIHPSSLRVDNFGNIELGFLNLVPMEQKQTAPRSAA